MQLQDKVIIITGAGQGLGRAIAQYLAEQRSHLALLDLDQAQLDATASLCHSHGVKVQSYLCNVSDEQQVVQSVKRIAEDFGAINGLINNAGILRDGLTVKAAEGTVRTMSLAQWQAVLDVNLTGVFLCTREVAAKMIELDNQGAIVNISSISRAGNVGQANYSAAKAGVAADTVVWARELARHGIRVGAVAPGFVATDMVASMKAEAIQRVTSAIPLQRLAQPQEIAHSVAFILENDYFTGRILEVDGGLRL